MDKLKKRWGITSNFQLVIIFVVFAVTGSASAWLSKPVCNFIGITREDLGLWFTPIRLIVIFPLYPFVLMFFGYLFGQSKFFFPFSKKMLRSIGLGFIFKSKS
jgi:hypothetical protein